VKQILAQLADVIAFQRIGQVNKDLRGAAEIVAVKLFVKRSCLFGSQYAGRVGDVIIRLRRKWLCTNKQRQQPKQKCKRGVSSAPNYRKIVGSMRQKIPLKELLKPMFF